MVRNPQALLTTKLILGAALVCIHASIRFGDAQRVQWSSIQLSTSGMRATAVATKTTKSRQPFACAWHGYTGRDVSSSWVLHWLASIAHLSTAQPELLAEGEPDFLFPHADMQCHSLPGLAPASYARTLLCVRWASQSADICGHSRLSPDESRSLTLRSMKSTALASAAQLRLPREDRLSQGHHRDSQHGSTHAMTPLQACMFKERSPQPLQKDGAPSAPWQEAALAPFQNLHWKRPVMDAPDTSRPQI